MFNVLKKVLWVGLLWLCVAPVLEIIGGAEVYAQVDTSWVRRYNGPGNGEDYANAIAVDGSGNVYVTGQSIGSGTHEDYATIKYYPNGDTAWVRRYSGPGNSVDMAYAIAVDNSGNVYVTGTDYWTVISKTIKYSAEGDQLWVGSWGGYDMVLDSHDDIYVCGIYVSGGSLDYLTVKYLSNGDTAWIRGYNGPANFEDEAYAITVDDSGCVYVTGLSFGSVTHEDYATIKYYPNGDTAWVRRYNGPGDSTDAANDIAVDGSGNVYVTGWSHDSGFDNNYATIKYYPDGDTAWVRRYYVGAIQWPYDNAMAVDNSGNVYVTGGIWDASNLDYLTIKYYPNGDTAWVRRYNGPGNSGDEASAIAIDGSGIVYVTGYSYGGVTNNDYATIKYYPDGDTAWVKRYNRYNGDWAYAIVVDGSDNVYVTGFSQGSGSSFDYATIKYFQYNHAPEDFSLLLPHNKSFLARMVHFDWETAADPDSGDSVRYDLFLSTGYHFPEDSTTIDSNLVESKLTKILKPGTYYWKVKAKDNHGVETWCNQVGYFMVTGLVPYPIGDFNCDGMINLGDVVFAVNYLFKSGPAPEYQELGDCNCDGKINLGDMVYLINYLFKGGPPPVC